MAYTKHNYKSGDKLFAVQLNEMDEQIAKNAEDVVTLTEENASIRGEIDALKGVLTPDEPGVIPAPEVVWEQGSINKDTGEELVAQDRIRTNYIPLSGVQSISVSIESGRYYVLDCYTADKTIVPIAELETGSWVSYTRTLVLPSEIAYVRFLLEPKKGTSTISPEENTVLSLVFNMENATGKNDYSAEIENTVKAVQTIMASSAEPMLTMAVFTDLHSENASQPVNPTADMFKCIELLNKRLNFDAVWNLGDMVDGQYYTQYENEGYLAGIVGKMKAICAASYVVPGNHDDNEQATRDQYAGLDASERMTVLEMHNAVQKFSPGIHCNPERYTDFYVDFEEYGIRAICVTADYTTFTTQTRDWLSSTALDTENAVLVMAHQATKAKWGYNYDVVNGDYIETALSAFASGGGTIIGYIHGHTHGDMIETDESISWTEIAIGCAKFETLTSGTEGITYQPRNANDYTKVLFDVVCVDKTNRKLHFVRCGAGADRVVTY